MMLIRSRGPLFFANHYSPFLSKPSRTLRRRCFTAAANKMSSSIEHLVLFKVKADTDSANLSAMIDGLNSLASLNQVLHISAGPIHRNRSLSGFTHILHSRYRSKDDLAAYAAHPAHVAVVKDKVLPVCDDIMALDWVTDDLTGPISPGSAMRITLLKLKDDSDKDEVLRIVRGVWGSLDKVAQSSVGENFSPGRAKGFSVASLVVYEGLEDLEKGNDSKKEELESYKEKVRPYVDEVVDVEYVIPSSPSQSANL